MEQIYKDFARLQVQTAEKVEGGFGGIWNVLANMEEKIRFLEKSHNQR